MRYARRGTGRGGTASCGEEESSLDSTKRGSSETVLGIWEKDRRRRACWDKEAEREMEEEEKAKREAEMTRDERKKEASRGTIHLVLR